MKPEGLSSLLQLNESVLRDYCLSLATPSPPPLQPAPSLSSQLSTPPWITNNVMYYSPVRRTGPSSAQFVSYPPFSAGGMPFNMAPMSPYYRQVSPMTLYNPYTSSSSRSTSYPVLAAPFMQQQPAGYSSPQGSIGGGRTGKVAVRRPLNISNNNNNYSFNRSRSVFCLGEEEQGGKISAQSSPNSVARSPADCASAGQAWQL